MTLQTGIQIAEKAVEYFRPLCERIEVAGSIRRRRPNVNDVDLVVILKEPALFEAACRTKHKVITAGPQNVIIQGARMQIDIFIAHAEKRDLLETTPTNWGSLMLCRTGSKEHNIFLVQHAKRLGLRWNPYHGVFDESGKCLASATEQEIFAALQLPFISPENRER